MSSKPYGLALLLAVLASVAPAAAQSPDSVFVAVRVLDRATESSIVQATVAAPDLRASAFTDSSGAARVGPVPAGRYRLIISRLGYQSASIAAEAGGPAIVVHLEPTAVTVESVTVNAGAESPSLRSAGFYERRARERGTFLTREEFQRVPGRPLLEVLRSVRGIRIVRHRPPMGGPVRDRVVSSRGNVNIDPRRPTACFMPIYLDGILLGGEGGELEAIRLDEVEAVEVYTGPGSVPTRFNATNSACGVVVIWTRSGP